MDGLNMDKGKFGRYGKWGKWKDRGNGASWVDKVLVNGKWGKWLNRGNGISGKRASGRIVKT
jgi:hypothetical protein